MWLNPEFHAIPEALEIGPKLARFQPLPNQKWIMKIGKNVTWISFLYRFCVCICHYAIFMMHNSYWIFNFYATFLLQQKIYVALIRSIVHDVYEFCVGDPKFPILFSSTHFWPKVGWKFFCPNFYPKRLNPRYISYLMISENDSKTGPRQFKLCP